MVYWACPETMGTSLEDVALVLEGSEAKVSKINPVVEAITEWVATSSLFRDFHY